MLGCLESRVSATRRATSPERRRDTGKGIENGKRRGGSGGLRGLRGLRIKSTPRERDAVRRGVCHSRRVAPVFPLRFLAPALFLAVFWFGNLPGTSEDPNLRCSVRLRDRFSVPSGWCALVAQGMFVRVELEIHGNRFTGCPLGWVNKSVLMRR